MSRFFEWCACFSGSRRILAYLEAQVTFWDNSVPESRPKRANPRAVSEISGFTGLADWRVRVCLRRLRRKGKVQMDTPDHWQLFLFP
jgi:hypothetical protein